MKLFWKTYSIILTIIGAFCGGMFVMWTMCTNALCENIRRPKVSYRSFSDWKR